MENMENDGMYDMCCVECSVPRLRLMGLMLFMRGMLCVVF